jgi:pyruvate-formate lyase
MNNRIEKILNYVLDKKHHQFRQDIDLELAGEFSKNNLSNMKRATERLVRFLQNERPVILPDERIVFLRTIKKIPEIFTESEWVDIKHDHFVHEAGRVFNINPDYATTITIGLEAKRKEVLESLKNCDAEGEEFLNSVIRIIDAVENLAQRYAEKAEQAGNSDVAEILRHIPKYGARSFHEALQFFRILHFTLWCGGHYHNTVGRFDQYMYPFLKADIDSGRLEYDFAFELLEEFFISFNKDSDLYIGVQQGDNGQSMVLGGVDENGDDAFNDLSEMCLKASLELKLIDPKINLRVHTNTKPEVYELGSHLTKQGLGFPQYSNDEIVIPGLVARGYDLENARDYVVAACWEFIIPKCGMDVPNIGALSFTKVIDECLHNNLTGSKTFSDFVSAVKNEIQKECDEIVSGLGNIFMEPGPYISLLMDGCIEQAKDISFGGKYNNYGIHGTGVATAADSLAAIKKYVFDEKTVTPEQLIEAVDVNYEEHDDLWMKLRYKAPKMGNNDDYVDKIGVELLDMFASALENKTNERGGCFRAGTGTAMYYLWHIENLGASPDGRKKGEPLSANFSPSLTTRTKGPISIIQSFSKPDMARVVNGGPLTLELHDTVFRNEESINKVAMLVKSYMDIGGQQLQLNAVNRERLIDAQKNPENHKNLIVRVWGWSGYFVELEKEYQDHIIARTELEV